MEHPILNAIRREAFAPLGWFAPRNDDGVPGDAQFVILVGNAGPAMFRRFASERDPDTDSLDDWCRERISALALVLDARAVFPFDKPPLPFLTWARRSGAGHVSPLGLNIHPLYGLWHAYRAALLFDAAFDLPGQSTGPSPCDSCLDKPCLHTCPAAAFDGRSYRIDACVDHVASRRGEACMAAGCLARHACPVGRAFAYHPEQAAFHMKAFRKSRLAARLQTV
jgi:epoxyqueuosine reductase QueG